MFLALDYQVREAATGCPPAEKIKESVASQLGYSPFKDGAEWHLLVVVDRPSGSYLANLRWTGAKGRQVGERQLTSRASDCHELEVSLAFAITVQIQLLAALLERPTPSPVPPAEAVAAPSPSVTTSAPAAIAASSSPSHPAPPKEPAISADPLVASARSDAPAAEIKTTVPPSAGDDSREEKAPARFLLSLGPSFWSGLTPRSTFGVRLAGALVRTSWSVELGLGGAPALSSYRADGSGVAAGHVGMDLAACRRMSLFRGCALVSGGRLGVEGFGVDVRASPAGFFAHAGLRAGIQKELGRYFLSFRLEGLVSLTRWAINLDHFTAWQQPRFAASAGLELGVQFF